MGWYREAPGAMSALLAKERVEALGRALETLTPRERICFVLREVEGIDTSEVAATLEISPVTVRRFCGLARQRLAAELRRKLGDGPLNDGPSPGVIRSDEEH
jgi:RNA polymerase sigma-70 factor, ECF subfamily